MFGISPELATLLGQILAVIAALLAAFVGYQNRRAIAETQAKVQEVKITVDGRLAELLMKTEAAAHAAGVASRGLSPGGTPLMTHDEALAKVEGMSKPRPK